MGDPFSILEKNILAAKGLKPDQIQALEEAGVSSRKDLETVGDAGTLRELLPAVDPETAEKVMSWATGRTASAVPQTEQTGTGTGKILLDTADVVYCTYCSAKQPKDYKSGDLCVACGKQAEPIQSCYWCGSSGPGKFCRSCGARFVPTAEFDLAVLLRHEGLPKDDIARRLESMSAADKDQLWARARRYRG